MESHNRRIHERTPPSRRNKPASYRFAFLVAIMAIPGFACDTEDDLSAQDVADNEPAELRLSEPLNDVFLPFQEMPGVITEGANGSASERSSEVDDMSEYDELEPAHRSSIAELFADEHEPSREDMLGQTVRFNLDDVTSGRTFSYEMDRAAFHLAAASEMSRRDDEWENPLPDNDREREDEGAEAWSNSTDSRVRKGSADGYSLKSFKMMGYYNGCGLTIVRASSTRIWAVTAAHCVFDKKYKWTGTTMQPRKDHSLKKNREPYGTWKVSTIIYDKIYKTWKCKSDDRPNKCFSMDFAIVRFTPGSNAKKPGSMGWAKRSFSELRKLHKYRRGYGACSEDGAPTNPNGSCTKTTLYGDGKLYVGTTSYLDPDGWSRVIDHGSDSGFALSSPRFPRIVGRRPGWDQLA